MARLLAPEARTYVTAAADRVSLLTARIDAADAQTLEASSVTEELIPVKGMPP